MWLRLAFFLLASSALLNAQEVKYVDLTDSPQRTDLRTPPAPPGVPWSGGGSVADGAPNIRDPHALGIELMRVIPADIDPAKPFEVEFRVVNTGQAPIELPVWPHLSDLQPQDESIAFTYLSIGLTVRVVEPNANATSLGFVQMYGSSDDARTVVSLKPGEWIRVRANVKLASAPAHQGLVSLEGDFWLHRTTFRPSPGGSFTDAVNIYPNRTKTARLPANIGP